MASTDNGTVYDFTAGMQLDKPPVPLINGCMRRSNHFDVNRSVR